MSQSSGTLRRFSEQIKLFLVAIFVILGRPQSEETAYDTAAREISLWSANFCGIKRSSHKNKNVYDIKREIIISGHEKRESTQRSLKIYGDWMKGKNFGSSRNKDARHLCQKKHEKPSK